MTNHEHPSESERNQPDQPDRPYSELGFFTQTFLDYVATGRLDPSDFSIEDLREADIHFAEMLTNIKSLVYEYLSNHDELPPVTGVPPELQQIAQLFSEQYHNDTQPPGTPPSPETP